VLCYIYGMKFLAITGIFAFLLTGMDGFFHQERHESALHMTFSTEKDCCEDQRINEPEKKDQQEHPHSCEGECGCVCCFHLSWIAVTVPSPPPPEGIEFHYQGYHDNYRFDFHPPLLHPPRTV